MARENPSPIDGTFQNPQKQKWLIPLWLLLIFPLFNNIVNGEIEWNGQAWMIE
jgi:hypothetical protein